MVEEWTEDCNLYGGTLHTPGETVARERLAAPGAFSLSARVQRDPELSLLAFALGQGKDEGGCEAGAWTSLTAADHGAVELILVAGPYPALK